jgi:hypothetical protein
MVENWTVCVGLRVQSPCKEFFFLEKTGENKFGYSTIVSKPVASTS